MIVFVALVIQNGMRMRRIVICNLSGCKTFPNYLTKGKILWGKKLIKIKMRVLTLSTILSATLLIVSKIERDVIKKLYWYLCKVPFILSDFNENSDFLTTFSKKNSSVKFHEKMFSGSRFVPRGRTGRHYKAKNCLSKFVDRA